ncbi:hypothetical protein [Methylomarinum vadi]|uniref:hypothetical protein n=1 Tax=Methylomarinum vadi TaxID=438855 RepID=UPI0004DF487A|nr:hypothetical protein [Methylomarinum vadi]
MKRGYQSLLSGLVLCFFGSVVVAESSVPAPSSISDEMVQQQREQKRQLILEQRKKIKADRDAAVRSMRAQQLKEKTQQR